MKERKERGWKRSGGEGREKKKDGVKWKGG